MKQMVFSEELLLAMLQELHDTTTNVHHESDMNILSYIEAEFDESVLPEWAVLQRIITGWRSVDKEISMSGGYNEL